MSCDIGVVGLGVMGSNLALNMERNGFRVAGYDRDSAKAAAFLSGPAAGKRVEAADSPRALMAALARPRRILLMVPAGAPVDDAIAHLKADLEPGDILVDGGNSFFLDTERRTRALATAGLLFVGTGVSGGEEGALWGPSIMPGGPPEAWTALSPILRAIAAKAEDGEPCVEHLGPGGAGHYVKMVHNGIEYGDMQLIAETYDLLSRGLGMTAGEIAEVMVRWNEGELRSYLVEITAKVLARTDPESGKPLVDVILDEAAHKGTGKWASQNAFDVGAPIPTINAAVEARLLSALKPQRVRASRVLRGPAPAYRGDRARLIDAAREALWASKVTSYAQGLGLMTAASKEYGWNLRMEQIAKIWRAGCIIRATLLGDIMAAYRRDPSLDNLLLDPAFSEPMGEKQESWRLVVGTAVNLGIPVPAMSASLAYYDAYRSERLPANLTQGQRDFFGAHTYRRVDRPGSFHTEW
jgi:6-phosphogluconate dehydrogenase